MSVAGAHYGNACSSQGRNLRLGVCVCVRVHLSPPLFSHVPSVSTAIGERASVCVPGCGIIQASTNRP